MTHYNKLARIAGFCYLVVILSGLFSEVFVRQAIRIPNDALGTAANIQLNEMLYRWGFVADLLNFVLGIPAVLIIYHLLRNTHRLIIQIALVFVIVQTSIIAINLLNQLIPLIIFSGDSYLEVFTADQKAAFSLLFLKIQAQGYAIGLVFFGFYCISISYVIFKSRAMPQWITLFYALVGVCYLINSFVMFLSKGFSNPLFLYLSLVIFLGELIFCLWLLFKGLDLKILGVGEKHV